MQIPTSPNSSATTLFKNLEPPPEVNISTKQVLESDLPEEPKTSLTAGGTNLFNLASNARSQSYHSWGMVCGMGYRGFCFSKTLSGPRNLTLMLPRTDTPQLQTPQCEDACRTALELVQSISLQIWRMPHALPRSATSSET